MDQDVRAISGGVPLPGFEKLPDRARRHATLLRALRSPCMSRDRHGRQDTQMFGGAAKSIRL